MGDAHVAQALAILYEQQARERSRGVDIEELSAFAADGLSAFLQTDTLSGEGGGLVFARRIGTCLTSSSHGLGTQRQLCVTPRSLSLYGPCLHAEAAWALRRLHHVLLSPLKLLGTLCTPIVAFLRWRLAAPSNAHEEDQRIVEAWVEAYAEARAGARAGARSDAGATAGVESELDATATAAPLSDIDPSTSQSVSASTTTTTRHYSASMPREPWRGQLRAALREVRVEVRLRHSLTLGLPFRYQNRGSRTQALPSPPGLAACCSLVRCLSLTVDSAIKWLEERTPISVCFWDMERCTSAADAYAAGAPPSLHR